MFFLRSRPPDNIHLARATLQAFLGAGRRPRRRRERLYFPGRDAGTGTRIGATPALVCGRCQHKKANKQGSARRLQHGAATTDTAGVQECPPDMRRCRQYSAKSLSTPFAALGNVYQDSSSVALNGRSVEPCDYVPAAHFRLSKEEEIMKRMIVAIVMPAGVLSLRDSALLAQTVGVQANPSLIRTSTCPQERAVAEEADRGRDHAVY